VPTSTLVDQSAESRLILRRIRIALALFITGLVLSGVTAFPLQRELDLIASARGLSQLVPADGGNSFDRWILTVRDGLRQSYGTYPWLAYGTDWLAFAHVVLAVFFVGPVIDPVRNVWILRAGVIACFLVLPLALICGAIRGIPWGWRLVDCSFGVFGVLPLWYCLRLTRTLEASRCAEGTAKAGRCEVF